MDFLSIVYRDNEVWRWIGAAAFTVLGFLFLRTARSLLVTFLTPRAQRSANRMDDLAVDLIAHSASVFLFVVCLSGGLRFLKMDEALLHIADGVLIITGFIQLGLWGNRLIHFWITGRAERKGVADPSAGMFNAVSIVARVFLWAVIVLLILDNLGVNVATLIAGLGVGGIAVALAVQNILGDLFASISIVLDKPVVIGDFLTVDTLQGTVEHIGLKTTRVRSISGEQLVFSNADMLKSRIRNFKRMEERRVLFSFGVTYGTRADVLAAIPEMVREIISSVTAAPVRLDRVHMSLFAEASINFEVAYYVLKPEFGIHMDVQQEILLGLVRKFDEQKIEFAFPTRTVFVQGKSNDLPAATQSTRA